MVVSNIIGGLGNQMFQYAASLAIVRKSGAQLKLDTSNFQGYELHHGYELRRVFDINTPIASREEVESILGWKSNSFIRKLYRRIFKGMVQSNYVIEPTFTYWANVYQLADMAYLEGYWQSEKYFAEIASEVRERFTFKVALEDKNLELSHLINTSNSVGLHVRRGDYVSNTANSKVYYQCSMDYYNRAIESVAKAVNNPVFFVFSDDIKWAKDNLNVDYEFVFIDHNRGEGSYVDMQLMSLCKHNIIANSTFSWWGAWLNTNPKKIVYSPKEWFVNGRSSDDLIPEYWNRI
jgi:hypothetical protein